MSKEGEYCYKCESAIMNFCICIHYLKGMMHPVNPLSLGIIERHAISCLHMVKAIGSNNVEVKHLRNEVLLK